MMILEARARAHAALGDAQRLRIVDALARGDLTFAELADHVGMKGNLLSHHLDVLGSAGLVDRRISTGDHRRRYLTLRWQSLPPPPLPLVASGESIAFVCTHNSARSQFAATFWEHTTGAAAHSAGSHPAPRVHPLAIRVASEFGVDLSAAAPAGYDHLDRSPDLIISVCDRARESGLPEAGGHLHWSVPDPVSAGTHGSFRAAFTEIAERVERLAGVTGIGR